MSRQEIKCNVDQCKYNENAEYCTLSSITVGNNTAAGLEAKSVQDTECDSFVSQSSTSSLS